MDEATRKNIERISRDAADAIFGPELEADLHSAILKGVQIGLNGGVKIMRGIADECDAKGIKTLTTDDLRNFATELERRNTEEFAKAHEPSSELRG